MNYEIAVAVLTPFFHENNFLIAESRKDYIRYEYKNVSIAVAYDWRDKSISVFIGQGGKFVAELSDDKLNKFFNDDIKLRNDNFFAENLLKFLNGKGRALLKADLNTLSELSEFTSQMAKAYTDSIIKEQNLRAADDAWQEKNYTEFIQQLNKIEKDSLPKTYLLKYQYALKVTNQ